jgi:hypothetical protein
MSYPHAEKAGIEPVASQMKALTTMVLAMLDASVEQTQE